MENALTVKNTEGTQSVPSIYSENTIQPNAMDAIWLFFVQQNYLEL